MDNKGIAFTTALFIITVIGIVGGGAFLVSQGGFGTREEAFPTVQPISTEIIDCSKQSCTSVRCDADECVVSGSMVVSKGLGKPQVTARTDDLDYGSGWIALDDPSTESLDLKSYCFRTKTSSVTSTREVDLPLYRTGILGTGGTACRNTECLFILDPNRGRYWAYDKSSCSANLDPNPSNGNSCGTFELCSWETNRFSADFNFCPQNDPNFAFCQGSKNTVSSSESDVPYFTDEKKIISGETISFQPTNADGTPITQSSIRIEKYDLSCLRAIEEGTACESGQKRCIGPQNLDCPSGFELVTSGQIAGNDDICYNPTESKPVCAKFDTSSSRPNACGSGFKREADVRDPIISGGANKYLKCDSTQTIGQSQCGAFGTQEFTAPDGQECFLLDSNGEITSQQGEGLGALSCPGDVCSIGQKVKTGDITFKECFLFRQCNRFSSDKTCPSGSGIQLVFDETSQECVFPPENSCNPQEAECIGSESIRQCKEFIVAGKRGFQWAEPTQCPGELRCDDRETNFADDFCSCEDVREQQTTSVQCISSTRYKEYSKDPNDPNSCPKYRDLGAETTESQICSGGEIITRPGCKFNNPSCASDEICDDSIGSGGLCIQTGCESGLDPVTGESGFECSSSEQCVNNECVLKPGCKFNNPSCQSGFICNEDLTVGGQFGVCELAGCGENTPGFECSTKVDSRGTLLEQCVSNSCQETSSEFVATKSNYVNSNTKCFGNTVYKADAITPTDRGEELEAKTFYRWNVKLNAENSLNGVCKEDFICLEESAGKASCVTTFDFVGILGDSVYGVGENIDNLTVIVTDKVPQGKENRPIIASLFEGGTEKKRLTGLRTDLKGRRTLNFDTAFSRTVDNLRVEVIVGDTEGENFKAEKQLEVKESLNIKLNCPASGFIGNNVKCTWIVENARTNELVSSDPSIVISQGETILNPINPTSTSVEFKTESLGAVDVKISVDKEGFIGDSEESIVRMQSVDINPSLKIDNTDHSLIGNGIKTGVRGIDLIVKDSTGSPSEIQSIDAIIRVPTGEEEDVTLTQESDGTWSSSFNFEEAGSTYIFKGTIIPSDITEDPIPFSYSISTLGTQTESDKSTVNLTIIIVGAVLVIIVVLIILIFLARRGRR